MKPELTKGAIAKNAIVLILAGGVAFNIGIALTALIITAIIGIPMAILGVIMMTLGGINLLLLPLHRTGMTREQGRNAGQDLARTLQSKLPAKLKWLIRI